MKQLNMNYILNFFEGKNKTEKKKNLNKKLNELCLPTIYRKFLAGWKIKNIVTKLPEHVEGMDKDKMLID